MFVYMCTCTHITSENSRPIFEFLKPPPNQIFVMYVKYRSKVGALEGQLSSLTEEESRVEDRMENLRKELQEVRAESDEMQQRCVFQGIFES